MWVADISALSEWYEQLSNPVSAGSLTLLLFKFFNFIAILHCLGFWWFLLWWFVFWGFGECCLWGFGECCLWGFGWAFLKCYYYLFFSCFYQVGKSYKDPYDNCTQYTCTESAGQFSLTSTIKVCLPFEEANCVPVSILQPEKGFCNEPWCWPGNYICCFEWVFLDLFHVILFEGNVLLQLCDQWK